MKKEKISEKFLNIWKLKNKLLNTSWLKEEIKNKIIKCLKVNAKKVCQNVWDAANVVLKENFITINA